jgi:hypothetical protein
MSVQDELERQRRAAEAKARGLQEWQLDAMRAVPESLLRDIVADSRAGISASASMLPSRKPSEEPPPAASGGTADLAVPGLRHVDAIASSFERRDRLEALIKERDLVRKMIDERAVAVKEPEAEGAKK